MSTSMVGTVELYTPSPESVDDKWLIDAAWAILPVMTSVLSWRAVPCVNILETSAMNVDAEPLLDGLSSAGDPCWPTMHDNLS